MNTGDDLDGKPIVPTSPHELALFAFFWQARRLLGPVLETQVLELIPRHEIPEPG